MSKKFTIFSAILIFCSVLVSCNKTTTTPDSNNNNSNTQDTNFYFTAKIDGTDWKADMSSTNTYATNSHSTLLTIGAALTTVTDGVFLCNLSGYKGAAGYTVGTGGGDNYIRYTTGSVGAGTYSAWKAETPGSSTTGTVTITKDENNIIEGTFSFDGYSEEKKTTKSVTDGKFRMKKQ